MLLDGEPYRIFHRSISGSNLSRRHGSRNDDDDIQNNSMNISIMIIITNPDFMNHPIILMLNLAA